MQGSDVGRASVMGVQGPAQAAAMQDAMQLMFGPDGTAMQFPLPSTAQQDQEQQQQQEHGWPSNKPALMQRLSVLARGPADSPSFRPFNMLAGPDASTSFSQQVALLSQRQDETDRLSPSQYGLSQECPPAAGGAGMDDMSQLSQPRLSMTGVVTDALLVQDSWLSSEPMPIPSAAKKGRKHSTAAGTKHSKSKAGQPHAVSEAGSEAEGRSADKAVQPEFSFSPLGDSSSRIQEIAFSPLAAGAGQMQGRLSVAQRIRKSLFGPGKDGGRPGDVNHVKVWCLCEKLHATSLMDSVLFYISTPFACLLAQRVHMPMFENGVGRLIVFAGQCLDFLQAYATAGCGCNNCRHSRVFCMHHKGFMTCV